MSSPPFIRQQERLAGYFRRFGLEGEPAFDIVAYQYVLQYPDRLGNLPRDVMGKWRLAHRKIEKEPHVVGLLNELAMQDSLGDRLPEWYQFFIGRRYREGSGKFFTPKPIASAMARLLPPRRNPVIMDPTCGGGTFLVEASHVWRDGRCTLVANDIEASLVELAMLTLSLAASSPHVKHYSTVNIFDPAPELTKWYGQVDYILANPPFSLEIEYEQFDSPLFSCGYRNSDALFIDTALKLLKPGGRLVCLLPHSIVANKEFAQLRGIVEDAWAVRGVIGLPEGVFHLSAGTTTRADIVILEKTQARVQDSRRLLFASVPSAGVRTDRRSQTPVANELEKVVASAEVREALGIGSGSAG
jgi:type I restriction-modification system DNA methylase subunit